MQFTGGLGKLLRTYIAAADRAVAHVGISHALAWPLISIERLGGGVRPGGGGRSLASADASLADMQAQLAEA